MQLADHIRPLLRDHDCVIIPDFGGLVAEPVPAQFAAARQYLAPPAKQVAFNQALTRNDGLLVDALSQGLRIPAAEAREVLRHAVEHLHQDLRQQQRTELPGIGVFRQAPGRGLAFDYTGTDNLLPAAFGLPALSVRPVLATDARLAREKRPALLQTAAPRRRAASPTGAAAPRLSRLARRGGVGLAAGLLVGFSYLWGVSAGLLPAAWRPYSAAETGPAPRPAGAALAPAPISLPTPPPPPPRNAPEPQQATLAHNGWSSPAETAPAALSAAAAPSGGAGPAPAAPVLAASAPVSAVEAPAPPAPTWKAPRPLRPAAQGKVAPALPASKTTSKTAGKATAAAAKKLALAIALPAATTINRRLGRSYVIAGAFATPAGAEACRRHLVRGGFSQAKVLVPNRTTRRFRASVADYADLASARAAAAQLRFKRKTFFDVYSY